MADETTNAAAGGEARWVRMERRLDASPERAHRAWSDPEELGRWLAPRVDGGLAVGGRTWLVWPRARTWWDVTVSEAGRQFAFRRGWHDDAVVTTTRVEFAADGYGTRIRIADGPFDVATAPGLDAWGEAMAAWAEALAMLRAHLDFSVDVRDAG